MSLLKDFKILQKLGEGTFSTVFKGKNQDQFEDFQIIKNMHQKKFKLHNLKQKIEKMHQMRSGYQLQQIATILFNTKWIFYKQEAFIDGQFLCIIMEIAKDGDLLQKIKQKTLLKSQIPEKEIWLALHQITLGIQINQGLRSLHRLKILHRDIKCANIFLLKDGMGRLIHKLGDLNVSKVAKQDLLRTQTGTPYYASPEVWAGKSYNLKSDIWSLGCMYLLNQRIYEMASLQPPFRAKDMNGLYRKVTSGNFDPIPPIYSQELSNIINYMLQVYIQMKCDPKQRPNCDEILKNKYLIKQVGGPDDYQDEDSQQSNDLLDTIKLPQNMDFLKDKLPKAQYDKTVSRHSRINSAQFSLPSIPIKIINPNTKNEIDSKQIAEQNKYQKYLSLDKQEYIMKQDLFKKMEQNKIQEIQKLQVLEDYSQRYLESRNQINIPSNNNINHNYQNRLAKDQITVQIQRDQLDNKLKQDFISYNQKVYDEKTLKPTFYLQNKLGSKIPDFLINDQQSKISQVNILPLLQKQKQFLDKHELLQKQLQLNKKTNLQEIDSIQRQQMYVRDKIQKFMQDGNQEEKKILQTITSNKTNIKFQAHLAAGQQIHQNRISKPSWWG